MDTTARTVTVADELKTAATALRETRMGATRGPWVPYPTISSRRDDESWTISRPWCNNAEKCEPDCGHEVLTTGAEGCEEDSIREGDVAWICLVNPELAEPLAAWLEDTANWFDEDVEHDLEADALVHINDMCDRVVGDDCKCFTHPLAVARAINGGPR